MLLSRDELLSALFRETDRVQRMKTPLSLIEFGIDDGERSRNQLGSELFDEAVREIVERTTRLLRSYDFMGALSEDIFLVALPGCDSSNAMMLAERLRDEVFGPRVRTAFHEISLSACFGIATSGGRSPFVVMQEAEDGLRNARMLAAGSIEYNTAESSLDPASFLSS